MQEVKTLILKFGIKIYKLKIKIYSIKYIFNNYFFYKCNANFY